MTSKIDESFIVIETLKMYLKAKRISYQDLVDHDGDLTVSILKGIFHRRQASLERLAQICAAANTSLFEIINMTRQDISHEEFLSYEQEELLASSGIHFLVFRTLAFDRLSLDEVCKQAGLESDGDTFRDILKDLESVNLIERHPQCEVKVAFKGSLTWRPDGPWMRKHYIDWSKNSSRRVLDTLGDLNTFSRFGFFSLSDQTKTELFTELNKVVSKYIKLAHYQHQLNSSEQTGLSWKFEITKSKQSTASYTNLD